MRIIKQLTFTVNFHNFHYGHRNRNQSFLKISIILNCLKLL